MGFHRQEYWSGLQFPTPGDLPDPGIKPGFPASPTLAGGFFTTVPPGKLFLEYFTNNEFEHFRQYIKLLKETLSKISRALISKTKIFIIPDSFVLLKTT